MWRWNPHQPPEDGLPPQEVRILQLGAEPWQDGRRVRISIEITPFLEPPNLEVILTNDQNEELSSVHIIQTVDCRMTFTMHIRAQEITGVCALTAMLSYPETGIVHQDSIHFSEKGREEASSQ